MSDDDGKALHLLQHSSSCTWRVFLNKNERYKRKICANPTLLCLSVKLHYRHHKNKGKFMNEFV